MNFDKAAGHASSPRQGKKMKKRKKKKQKNKVLMKFESKEQVIGFSLLIVNAQLA